MSRKTLEVGDRVEISMTDSNGYWQRCLKGRVVKINETTGRISVHSSMFTIFGKREIRSYPSDTTNLRKLDD